MRRWWIGCATFAGFLAGTAAAAPLRVRPDTPPELRQLDFFNGEWSCTGHMEASAHGPAADYNATLKSSPTLEGHWDALEYVQKPNAHMAGSTTQGYWGWVPEKHEFVHSFYDSQGHFEHGTSLGWEGNTLTWKGECNCADQIAPFRHIFTKQSEREFTSLFEVQMHGKWQVFADDTCHKTSQLTER